jgi:hypothetical protein
VLGAMDWVLFESDHFKLQFSSDSTQNFGMVCFRWSCLYTQKGVKNEKFWPEFENKFKLGKILTYFSHVSAGSPRCGPIKPKMIDPKGHIGRLRAGFPLPQLTSFGILNPCALITFNYFIFKC